MTLEEIMTILVAVAPSIVSIIGIVSACLKLKGDIKTDAACMQTKFEELKVQVEKSDQYETLKSQLIQAHRENVALKKQINELLTKIDHIQRGE